jgi:DNA replication protein DnaC
MSANKKNNESFDESVLKLHLKALQLSSFLQNYEASAAKACAENWTHQHFLAELAREEVLLRQQRATARRIKLARFPVLKTLDSFIWSWPKKINRLQIENFFHLGFVPKKNNVIFIGGVGIGKSHLSIALAYHACINGYSVLFSSAIDIVNSLSAAQNTGKLKAELQKYLKPSLLLIDELGFLPVDKRGADLLFQVISGRYEHGSIILTTNKVFKDWPELFNNDSTLTSAVLDRLLHNAEVAVIEGKSFRMKDQIKE